MLKTSRILNPALLQALAGLGHNDYLVIANAAFPIEPGIPVVDLSLAEGMPSLEQVLQVVAQELAVDSSITPSELPQQHPEASAAIDAALPGLPRKEVMYEQLKVLAKHARAVVRTGECRPYASVILLAAGL